MSISSPSDNRDSVNIFEEIAALAAIEAVSSISTIVANFYPFPSILELQQLFWFLKY
jgi:hypothetical protein